jgi:transcriptional regulator of acetoin/glycerol metabolism
MTNLAIDQVYQVWKKFIKTREIDTGTIREEVAESWKRCLFVHKLDSYAPKQPIRLSQEEIAKRLQRNSALMDYARPFLQVLESAVRGSGFIITLSDSDGYVLDVHGDEEIIEMAAANNYLPGCCR